MSASREKNKRKELNQNAAAEAAPQKKGMSQGAKKALGIVITAVVLAIIVFFYLLTSGFFAKHTTAAVIGEHKLSAVGVNYYYQDAYSNFIGQFGQYADSIIDPNTPLDEQISNEETGATWADSLLEQGLTDAAQIYAMYDAAIAAGHTLSEEEEASLKTQLDTMELYANMYGFANVNQFLSANYGVGCDKKSYEDYARVGTLAQSYANATADAMSYTAEEIAAEYAADPSKYDAVTYRVFTFDPHSYGEDLTHEEQSELAEKDAQAMVEAVTDDGSFVKLSYENAPEGHEAAYEDSEYTLRENARAASIVDEAEPWLYADERVEGDCTYVMSGETPYVLYFISRDDHDYATKNVRHILIPTTEDDDEETKAAAKATADDILAQYLAGEQTEEAFAALSEKMLEDATAMEATKYENVAPGEMVESFNDWIYDETRQTGDTAVVETEYGYHVMYFCGDGENYRDQLVEDSLHTAEFNTWYEGTIADATYTLVPFGAKFISK